MQTFRREPVVWTSLTLTEDVPLQGVGRLRLNVRSHPGLSEMEREMKMG